MKNKRPAARTKASKLSVLAAVIGAAQAAEPSPPTLAHVFTAKVNIAATQVLGEFPNGAQRYIPITGGTFEGPLMKGEVVPGGADWPLTRRDGATEIKADYALKTDDGVIIKISNHGLVVMHPAKEGQPASSYRRTIPSFQAPAGKYEWLNKSVFVGTLDAQPNTGFVVITVYRVE